MDGDMKTTVPVRFVAALALGLLVAPGVCTAQSANPSERSQSDQSKENLKNGKVATVGKEASKPAIENAPLTNQEREEMLKLIKELQERVAKLEAAQSATSQSPSPTQSSSSQSQAKPSQGKP